MYTEAVHSSHNWRRTLVRQYQSATKSVPLRTLTSHALSRTHFHTPLHRAHRRRAHISRTWPYKCAQIELNKMRSLHRSLPASLSHSSTKSYFTHSFKHSMISGPFLPGLTALHVLYSAVRAFPALKVLITATLKGARRLLTLKRDSRWKTTLMGRFGKFYYVPL